MKPAEGTILTVSRLTADAARELAAENNEIEYVLQHCLDTAHAALDNTVNQNPVLKKAGVEMCIRDRYRQSDRRNVPFPRSVLRLILS